METPKCPSRACRFRPKPHRVHRSTEMRPRVRSFRLPLVLMAALGPGSTASLASAQQMDVTRYHRAERLLAWNVDPLISGGPVSPTWMAGGSRFWYRNQTASGAEFVVADPEQRSRTLLFDHNRLAAAMSLAADTAFDGSKLPFRTFEFGEADGGAADGGAANGVRPTRAPSASTPTPAGSPATSAPTTAWSATRWSAAFRSCAPRMAAPRPSCTSTICGSVPSKAATRRS